MNTDDQRPSDSPPANGSALLTRLYNHRAMMAPHQKERHTGKLLLESIAEIERLEGNLCALAADALNARQCLHEWMVYVRCGQVPEDSHAVKRSRALLATPMLDAQSVRMSDGGRET